jgi:hypothetical protein
MTTRLIASRKHLEHVTLRLVKFYTQVIYMYTKLIMIGVLKDFQKKRGTYS